MPSATRIAIVAATPVALRRNPGAAVADDALGAFQDACRTHRGGCVVESLERGDAVLSEVPLRGEPTQALACLVESSWNPVDQSRALLAAAPRQRRHRTPAGRHRRTGCLHRPRRAPATHHHHPRRRARVRGQEAGRDQTALLGVEWQIARWVAWYNATRLHSSIAYASPIEYEQRYRDAAEVAIPEAS